MNKIIEIKDKQDCCGCQSCSNICPNNCIAMKTDNEGFWYPEVNFDLCNLCGLCKNACPLLNPISVKNIPVAYACINKNDTVRALSSSGGIFTTIAEQIINNHGVVFGAEFDESFRTIHGWKDSSEGLMKVRGSKYVQSDMGTAYLETLKFLNQSRSVLFTGTPCQIAGLKSFLGRDYKDLTCIDIICHGVPSPLAWQRYLLQKEEKAEAKAKQISFRNKISGWKRYSISIEFDNSQLYLAPLNRDPYMKAFLQNIDLRPSCYDCKFKSLHRQSDITLGDFWGVETLMPEMDDDKGTSLIIVNSETGMLLVNTIEHEIVFSEADLSAAVSLNPSAIMSAPHNPKRQKFFEDLGHIPFDALVRKYCVNGKMIIFRRRVGKIFSKISKIVAPNYNNCL